MRRLVLFFLLCGIFAAASARAATGRVIKVLPQFLDLQGRHTLSPSLYDRDAYQVVLRDHPEKRSGIRFAVQWKIHGEKTAQIKLRVELRGTAEGDLPSKMVLETALQRGGWFSHWTSLPVTGNNYTKIGEVTAWRVTLWEGDRLLSEQKSFLW
jgi:hypothetical protein